MVHNFYEKRKGVNNIRIEHILTQLNRSLFSFPDVVEHIRAVVHRRRPSDVDYEDDDLARLHNRRHKETNLYMMMGM